MNTLLILAVFAIGFILPASEIPASDIPVTDCNLFISNGEMYPGYHKESTIYSEDCIIDWSMARVKIYEDGSFVLTISPIVHRIYIPTIYTGENRNNGFGFGCDLENEDDHILVVCETTDGTKFPYTPETNTPLIPVENSTNQFIGCLAFGLCVD